MSRSMIVLRHTDTAYRIVSQPIQGTSQKGLPGIVSDGDRDWSATGAGAELGLTCLH